MLRGVACALLAAVLTVAAPAAAHDSLAPRGADHRWLPAERWVEKHWMPFDEADLYRELRVDTPEVFEWLYDDHRTLADLARRQGVAVRSHHEHGREQRACNPPEHASPTGAAARSCATLRAILRGR